MFDFLKKYDKVINVNDLDNIKGKYNLIDIRESFEYFNGAIKGSRNIPMGTLLANPDKYLSKSEQYYVMCQSGGRSGQASKSLAKQGYDIVNVVGGMGAYVGVKRK